MKPADFQLYLASQSPRRQTLLQQIGIQLKQFHVDIDETVAGHEYTTEAVSRLAVAKVEAGWQHPERQWDIPVLAADTLVVCDDQIMGKPADESAAVAMLLRLSDRQHHVMTAVAVKQGDRVLQCCQTSVVTFDKISPAEAHAYWQTGEPADKAGAYAVQGRAALWIKSIDGSYSGVMGLPLFETGQMLKAFNVL